MAIAAGVFQRDQECARHRRKLAVIAPAPGVDIQGAVGGHRHMPRMTDVFGEYGHAEPGGQGDPGFARVAGFGGRSPRGLQRVLRRAMARRHQRHRAKRCSGKGCQGGFRNHRIHPYLLGVSETGLSLNGNCTGGALSGANSPDNCACTYHPSIVLLGMVRTSTPVGSLIPSASVST